LRIATGVRLHLCRLCDQSILSNERREIGRDGDEVGDTENDSIRSVGHGQGAGMKWIVDAGAEALVVIAR